MGFWQSPWIQLLVAVAAALPLGAIFWWAWRKLRLRRYPGAALVTTAVVSAHEPESLEITLHGREEELEQLETYLATRPLLVIEGMAGIGKTTLGRALGHRPVMKDYTGVWVDCKRGMSLEGLVAALATFLGEGGKDFAAILTQQFILVPQQGVDAFVAALNRGRYALFLDDFHLVDDAVVTTQLLLALKRRSDGARTVVMTRELTPALRDVLHAEGRPGKSSQARGLPLGGLETDPALELLADCRLTGERKALTSLCHKVEGHPKALELCASLAQEGVVLPRLLEIPLYDKGQDQPLLPLLRQTDKRLSRAERRMLRRCAVFDEPFSEEGLKQLYGREDWATVAEGLRHRFLLSKSEGLYSLHPLLRDYFYDKLMDERQCHRLAGEHYLALAAEEGDEEKQVELHLKAHSHFSQGQAWWHLTKVPYDVYPSLVTWGRWQEAMELCQSGLEATRRLGNRKEEAVYLHAWGNMHYLTSDYAEARRLYQESLEIARRLGDQSSIANTLHQMGIVAHDQGEYAEAWRLYQESLEIAKRLGDQSGIAKALHNLGLVARAQGDYAEARRLYQESLETKERLGDQRGMAKSLNALGNLAVREGDYEAARQLLEQSLDIARRLGDKLQIGYATASLSNLEEARGNLGEALVLMKEAETVFRQLGVPQAEQARRDRERIEGKMTSDERKE